MKWFSKDKPYFISASLICGDPLRLSEDLEALGRADTDSLHFDVMDGHFVPRLGLYPEMLKVIKSFSKIPVDVHLMVSEPEKYLPVFLDAGADLIAIHAEANGDLLSLIRSIKERGKLAGVAINPETQLSAIDSVVDEIDLLMIMAIKPGILGQKMIPETLQKISDAKEKLKHRPEVIIEIDGGVTPESAPEMVKRGANMLVCGTGTIYRPHEDTLENKVAFLHQTIVKDAYGA
jgi:ribulose-phosphate 3-epimerase